MHFTVFSAKFVFFIICCWFTTIQGCSTDLKEIAKSNNVLKPYYIICDGEDEFENDITAHLVVDGSVIDVAELEDFRQRVFQLYDVGNLKRQALQ